MLTLGINAAFHDSSATLVDDGRIIAAAEEERFTQIKHGKRPLPFSTWELPFHAIDFCLKEAGVRLGDVAHVAYSFDPYSLLRGRSIGSTIELPLEPSAHPVPEEWESAWDPLFVSSIVNAKRHLIGGVPLRLQKRMNGLSLEGSFQWHFVTHHVAHAASAFFPSRFDRAAILVMDGRGERAATSYGLGEGDGMEFLGQVDLPHSLGLLYEEVTRHLGFLHSSDEYKVMAMASYGKDRYQREFASIVQVLGDGQYRVNSADLAQVLGPARKPGEEFREHHFDIAHSLQKSVEKTVLGISAWLHKKTSASYLCMAGGVALNCVMNARLRDEGPFEEIWVQPASGDAGTSLGAALWVDIQERKKSSGKYLRGPSMEHAYLGPSFNDDEIEAFLRWSKQRYRKLDDLAEETASLLARDKLIGWFQGKMEFGPRALGARSILASPCNPQMQEWLNDVKEREDFRPVAPVVLEEKAADWFHSAHQSPFMLFVNAVKEEVANRIPAVRHVDGTARIQTINRDQNARYYDLLKKFGEKTGVPILINTSFNSRGNPIVCDPRDAVECFASTPLDALVIGSFLLEK